MWSLGRGLVAIQLCFLHIEEKRLADFCAGEKSKMNRRYSKNSLYARSLYAGGATCLYLTYIIHSGFISGYQNRYGDNLKPPTNVYHRMTA